MEENILPVSRANDSEEDMEEERRLMYVAITRAKKRLFLTRSKSRYLYGKREPSGRSRFLKELSSELELPKETRPMSLGYSDYDDPEAFGNSAYGGGRYETNYQNRSSYSGNYGGGYSANYGSYGNGDRNNSAIKRSAWNGGSQGYSSTSSSGFTYGGSSSVNRSHIAGGKKEGGFTYGGISRAPQKTTATGGKDLSAFKVGVRVQHPKFGAGVIVSVRGMGVNMILDIAFEGLGIKQLSATLAPLTIMG
jgi:DNA helicase-2/ATP-dependent DNA helicase PcrA